MAWPSTASTYASATCATGIPPGPHPSFWEVSFTIGGLAELTYRFPTVALSMHTAVLGELLDHVQDGTCSTGITGIAEIPDTFMQKPVGTVEMVAVVAPKHPLALCRSDLSDAELAKHVHIVVADHSSHMAGSAALGFASTKRWSVFDSYARHQLITAGLG